METFLWWSGGAVAVGLALNRLWKHVLQPGWGIVKAVVHFAEIAAVIIAIGEEFKANDGHTLRDSINRIEDRVTKIEGHIEKHILNQRPNGRRSTDPQVP